MRNRQQSDIMRKLLSEVTRCELCGATRHLEAHHIIPLVFGGQDIEDNIIIVCEACHVKLTPKSLLVKEGIRKTKANNERIITRVAIINQFAQVFYERLHDECEENRLDFGDILDIFDEEVKKFADKGFRKEDE